MTQGFQHITAASAALVRKALGKRLKHITEERGITRSELAAILGTTDTRVARIMKGSSEITTAELVWTAKLLECSIDHLTGRA